MIDKGNRRESGYGITCPGLSRNISRNKTFDGFPISGQYLPVRFFARCFLRFTPYSLDYDLILAKAL